MRDVRIDEENKHFKFRVAGLLNVGEKYLLVKMNNNDFWCLPGGHVELGETAEDAIVREMTEELGFEIKKAYFIGDIQNFFQKNDDKYHEICYYYKCTTDDEIETNDFYRIEDDHGYMQKLQFKWVTAQEIIDNSSNIHPSLITEFLNQQNLVHLVIKDVDIKLNCKYAKGEKNE